jgi:hypothetical protein
MAIRNVGGGNSDLEGGARMVMEQARWAHVEVVVCDTASDALHHDGGGDSDAIDPSSFLSPVCSVTRRVHLRDGVPVSRW